MNDALDAALKKQVLLDLFVRLRTTDLVASCCCASGEWRALIENNMHAVWQNRAQRLCDAARNVVFRDSMIAPFPPTFDLSASGAIDVCVAIVKQAHKRWYAEAVMRSWRKTFLTQSIPLRQVWTHRCTSVVDTGAADSRLHVLACDMRDELLRTCAELEERIIEDDNDAALEANLERIEREARQQQATAACVADY